MSMFDQNAVIVELPKYILSPLSDVTHQVEEIEYLLPPMINSWVSQYTNQEIGGGQFEYIDKVLGDLYENDIAYDPNNPTFIDTQECEKCYSKLMEIVINELRRVGAMSVLIKALTTNKQYCYECTITEYGEVLRCMVYLLRRI